MSALDDLFQPVIQPANKPVTSQQSPPIAGVVKRVDALSVEILTAQPRSSFINAALDVMDAVALAHSIAGQIIDVRLESIKPRGALDLSGVTARYYDGNEEIWVSRPHHMPPDLLRFRGRFGYRRSARLPQSHGNFSYVCWSWLETNAGELAGIDVGIILIPTTDRWYRLFSNKTDATAYYQS